MKCLFDRMSTVLGVMTVRTVLKVPFKKAAPLCPSDVPAPLTIGEIREVVSFIFYCYFTMQYCTAE